MLQLAGQPHSGLPAPDASLVKVDASVAFSSQPTTAQLASLSSFGFKSLLCLTHPDELGAEATEGTIASRTGLVFKALPPPQPARVSTSHVEVDLMPEFKCEDTPTGCMGVITSPAGPVAQPTPSLPAPTALACMGEDTGTSMIAPAAGGSGFSSSELLPPPGALGHSSGFSSGFSNRSSSQDSASTVGSLLAIPAVGSAARRRASSVSSEDVAGMEGEPPPSPGGRSMVSGLTGVSDLSGRDVWTLDGADLAGREPGEDAWTVEWFAAAVAAVGAAEKPVLVHDTTGVAACAVALAQAGAKLGADLQQVMTWARTLGHDIEEHADLATALQAFLAGDEPAQPAAEVSGGH